MRPKMRSNMRPYMRSKVRSNDLLTLRETRWGRNLHADGLAIDGGLRRLGEQFGVDLLGDAALSGCTGTVSKSVGGEGTLDLWRTGRVVATR